VVAREGWRKGGKDGDNKNEKTNELRYGLSVRKYQGVYSTSKVTVFFNTIEGDECKCKRQTTFFFLLSFTVLLVYLPKKKYPTDLT
jgi:hypothetical protein